MASLTQLDLVWGSASRALDTEQGSGDAGLVVRLADGVFIGVVDGLGHGPSAAATAGAALRMLEHSAGPGLADIVECCHEGLRDMRGAAMALAWVDWASASLTWLGIGSMVGVLHRREREPAERMQVMPQFGGIVGRHVAAVNPAVIDIEAQDTLVLATDGIDPARVLEPLERGRGRPEAEIARELVETHATRLDDAYVLVARFRG